MAQPLTAEELLPLFTRLSPKERLRLFKLAANSRTDAQTYEAAPVSPDEFDSDVDPLAWDADGWENFE